MNYANGTETTIIEETHKISTQETRKLISDQENGIKKMNYSVLFSMGLTTVLHFISMICSYLTDPITPEDVVIYRKAIGSGKDIAMTISKLFITLSLMFTVPGYFFGLRLGFANSFTGGKISKIFNIIFEIKASNFRLRNLF